MYDFVCTIIIQVCLPTLQTLHYYHVLQLGKAEHTQVKDKANMSLQRDGREDPVSLQTSQGLSAENKSAVKPCEFAELRPSAYHFSFRGSNAYLNFVGTI